MTSVSTRRMALSGLMLGTSSLTFFRSMGGAIGVSALGAVLAGRATSLLAVIAVLFIEEKPLHTLSGDERRAREEGLAVSPRGLPDDEPDPARSYG